jgi:hypothetical protein
MCSSRWSRWLVQLDPGLPMIASISSRDRKPSIGRSKRFIGTPSACSTTCSAFTSR